MSFNIHLLYLLFFSPLAMKENKTLGASMIFFSALAINSHSFQQGFTLEFHFSPNEFFSNEVLKKIYYLNFDPPSLAPLEYEGPEIVQCRGTPIQWEPGKNVTLKRVRKVQKKKGTKEKRTLMEMVETESFFLFFSPPTQCKFRFIIFLFFSKCFR